MALTTISDIDIYLLYYLDLQSLLPITLLCKSQYTLLSDQAFIKELRSLKQKHKKVNVDNIISHAIRYNYIAIINWIHQSRNRFNYGCHAIYKACRYGNIEVLEWFDKSHYIFKYNNTTIDEACKYGYVSVLEWFVNSRYKFKYLHGIRYASVNGHVSVLEWFDKSEYKFIYTHNTIDLAASNGYIDVLEWFDKSKYEFLYTHEAINLAASNGYIDVLEWFAKSGYEFLYTVRAINLAASNGHIDVLEWFDKSDYEFKFKQKIITKISKDYHIPILQWFDNSTYNFDYKTLIELERRGGHTLIHTFNSCKSKFMCEAIYLTAWYRKIRVLELFKNYDYAIAFVYKIIKINKYNFYSDVKLWFKQNIRKYRCTLCSKKIKTENKICKQCENNNNIVHYRIIINVVIHVSLLGLVIFAKKYLN